MAFLKLQAERIRDTVIQEYNSNIRISNWMLDVVQYINKPTDAYFEICNDIAILVKDENNLYHNTANRLGLWCENAIKYAGINYGNDRLLHTLVSLTRRIKTETEDKLNERRLGMWFVYYLTYIGYSGDTETYIWQSQGGSLILSNPNILIVNEYIPT